MPLTDTDVIVSSAPAPQGPPVESSELPVLRIRPVHGWVAIDFAELWRYRELVYFLTWRDVKVRYKQTVLGAAWAVLQPLLTMLIFSLVFGRLARMPSDGVPYPLFALAALVPWTFFSNGMTQSANSLVANANVISKVYFPRLAVPIATVLSGTIDFLLGFLVLMGMVAYYGVAPTWQLAWLPLFVLMVVTIALGVGLWLSAMNVLFRDVRHAVPFLAQFWLFATPIAYPSSLLHEPWRTLFGLNPMAGAIEGFRWALLGPRPAPVTEILLSAATAIALLVSGAFYFRRMERSFGETV